MKRCAPCNRENADTSKFCQYCGHPLDLSIPSGDKTVLWGNRPIPTPRVAPQAATLESLFAGKGRLVIGRAADCDICLPHPLVSRYHALMERIPGGVKLRDLASINGTWLAGKKITESMTVREGDHVGIGPYLFHLHDGKISTTDSTRGLRLEARHLEKAVTLPDRSVKKLLDDVNIVVQPGEFVTLLGPSGSGKSTLMDCLNGRRRATGGKVLANGADFYQHFDNFRQSLGYVPQKDIVHYQLTVQRALYYTARLRLPTDTDPSELQARVQEVLRQMDLLERRDTLIANLSGGQIKRVSLGAELLAEPSVLYIDEATSGLDAGTETRMMRLFRGLANEGRSIICITHALDNVDQCHLILVLARGHVVYYGPPAEAAIFFKVPKISQMYDRVNERDPATWVKDFEGTSIYKEFVENRLAQSSQIDNKTHFEPPGAPEIKLETSAAMAGVSAGTPTTDDTKLGRRNYLIALSHWPNMADAFRELKTRYVRTRKLVAPILDPWFQFRVLTARTVDLIIGDGRGLRLLMLQAPIVALFLLVGFVHKPYDEKVSPFDVFMNKEGELTPEAKDFLQSWKGDLPLGPNGSAVAFTGNELYEFVVALRQHEELHAQAESLPPLRFKDKEIHLTRDGLATVRQQYEKKSPRYTYMLTFILVMIVMWFGCNNSAKEIVKEEAIYSRERAVNLGIFPYLASKFVVFSVITAFHSMMLMLILYGSMWLTKITFGWSVPDPEFRLGFFAQFGVLVLLGNAGVALGLLLSACVATPDRANALLPYVLIPQPILGGGFLSVESGLLRVMAYTLSPVYWGYRAIHINAHNLPLNYPGYVEYEDTLWLPCLVLLAETVAMLLATAWFLKRKEA